MQHKVTLRAAALLTLAPLLWAGNAVVGRMLAPQVSPMTLNLLRWTLAAALLAPLGARALRRGNALWTHWRWFAFLSLFSIGGYNALLYLALNTSTPINVTLVGASTPVWMLLIGKWFFHTPVRARQWAGAALSLAGVALVLSRGQWATLRNLHLVAGDVYILLASMAWAYYSWLITRPPAGSEGVSAHWASFLLAQVLFGLGWSAAFSGAEWLLTPAHIDWSWGVAAALVYIAVGPAVTAYAAWGTGVGLAGPAVAGFFINLTPLFTALLSAAFLGEPPQLYHALAFVLIVWGIVLSSRRV